MKTRGGEERRSTLSLTLALDVVVWSAPRPDRFTSGNVCLIFKEQVVRIWTEIVWLKTGQ